MPCNIKAGQKYSAQSNLQAANRPEEKKPLMHRKRGKNPNQTQRALQGNAWQMGVTD